MADESLNVDDAENVGNEILASMVGHSVAEYKFSKKKQVKILASAVYVKSASGEQIEMDPQRLYQRLLATGIGNIPLPDLFQYELCSFPPSLFDNHMRMRIGDKAELIHDIVKLVPSCIVAATLDLGLQFVVDGGGLLHKFPRPKICAMYIRHVHSRYIPALVVFDGYHGRTTKDKAHRRRTSNDVGATVSVSPEMRLTMTKRAFIENSSNKQAFINILATDMMKSGIDVDNSEADADYKICMLACLSATKKPTAVVAEDSDKFQLMIHHADATDKSDNLYMVTSKQTVCVIKLKQKLEPALSESLLFMHALSGCDSTSRPYGIGKATVLTKYATLKMSTAVFMSPSSTKDAIEKAGADALLVTYGSKTAPSLDSARVMKFQLKVATSAGYVPPTNNAAAFHSYGTYHQCRHGVATICPLRTGFGDHLPLVSCLSE